MNIHNEAVITVFADTGTVPDDQYEYLGEFSFQNIDLYGKEFAEFEDRYHPRNFYVNYALYWPQGQMNFKVWVLTRNNHKNGITDKKLAKWKEFMKDYKV